MKSKAFLNNSFKARTKGQLWIPAFLAIGFLFAFPVAEIIKLGEWKNLMYTVQEIEELYRKLWVNGLVKTGCIVAFAAAFINGVNGFWYLYSSSKVDFYHSLPVKRSRMFAEKTVVGILYFLVPYVVMEFLAVCIGALQGFFSLVLMGMALKMLFIHLLMYLMGYFCVVLAISLTGNLLTGAIVTAGLFLYAPILSTIMESGEAAFFSAYPAMYSFQGTVPERMGSCFSPFTLSGLFMTRYSTGEGYLKYLLFIGLFAAIAAAAAFFAYTKRPLETAGKSMVYRFTEPIAELLAVIPAGLWVGLFMREIASQGGNPNLWWVLGLIFGTILVHGMVQVILRMDFRGFLLAKLQLLLAGVGVAGAALVFQFDLLGYNTYIPKYDNLKQIEVDWQAMFGNESPSGLITETDGKYEIVGEYWENTAMKNQQIYDLIKRTINKQEGRREDEWGETFDHVISLKYINNWGRTILRQYRVTTEEIREFLRIGYENGNLKETNYSFLRIDPRYLESTDGNFGMGVEYALFQEEKEKQKELAEALAKDIGEADADTLLGVPAAKLNFNYRGVPMTNGSTRDFWQAAYVYPEYERTLAILEETGYPLYIENAEIESAQYTVSIPGHDPETVKMTFTDKDELEELTKAMVPYEFDTVWVKTEEDSSLVLTLTDGRGEVAVKLWEEKIPQFIKDELEKAQEGDSENQEPLQDSLMGIEDSGAVNDEDVWIDRN